MEPYEFWVDLTPDGNKPESLIHCSQDDIGRPYLGHVYYLGEEYSIPSGSTVEIQVMKPDGNYKVSAAAFAGAEVYFELEEQMAVVPGKCLTEIIFNLPTGERLGTKNFYLMVEPGAIDGGTPSESELSWLQQTENNARAAQQAADTAVPAAARAGESADTAAEQARIATQKAEQATEDVTRAERILSDAETIINRAEQAAAAQVPWSVADGKVCITYKKEVEA